MALNPTSFRMPFNLPEDLDPEVRRALEFTFNGLTNHEQAFRELKPSTNTTTTTVVHSSGGSGGGGTSTGIGGVNDQTGSTAYSITAADNGVLLILNDASPVAVTLNSAMTTPYFLFITNFGAGIATLTPTSGLINGAASYTLSQNESIIVVFAGVNWKTNAISAPPADTPAVTHKWLNSYTSATGVFTQTQPDFTDVSGVATTAQIGTGSPAAGKYVDGAAGAWTTLPAARYTPVNASGTTTAAADQAIFCNTAGAGFTVTLPAAASNSGHTIIVKKISADANVLTVSRAGGDVIDGATTWTTTTQYVSITLLSDGVSNWWIV